jgi:L-ascorbate metabolism protein UlaG (beta-lactamase superfamily)
MRLRPWKSWHAGLLRAALVTATVSATPPTVLGAQSYAHPAREGPIRVTPFVGASVQIEYLDVVIHVDPWSRADYSTARDADLVLVTDTPADHLDPELIGRLRKVGATVILPSTPGNARDEGGAARVRAVPDATVMNNGERTTLRLAGADGPAVGVEAVAMYDIIPGEPFHAKGEGNGYVVTVGGVRIYFSGVTECTPEMRAVEDVDVLFVPMNLPNGRMPPAAAAECTRLLGPDIVYPYHYREQPIDDFVDALRDSPIRVIVHDWYPPA